MTKKGTKNVTPRRQRPIKGGRAALPACVISQIADHVEMLARRFNVSKSFVIAVALADQFGLSEEQEHYREKKKT